MKLYSIMLTAIFTFAASGAGAEDYKLGTIEVIHPWARATPRGAKVGGAYLTIKNNGTAPDRLVAVTAAAAGRVEIHEMAMTGSVMTMRKVDGGLEIKPGETVAFKSGGFHLMLMDLTAPLLQGKPVKGTLTFAESGTIAVTFDVEGVGAEHDGHDGHGHAGH